LRLQIQKWNTEIIQGKNEEESKGRGKEGKIREPEKLHSQAAGKGR
jgi:hypothetical protein